MYPNIFYYDLFCLPNGIYIWLWPLTRIIAYIVVNFLTDMASLAVGALPTC